MSYNYLDLFAGAGGLSEGFIRAGFNPVAHIDADEAACYTIKTRMAYKWLQAEKKEIIYEKYLSGTINRSEFYSSVPSYIISSVIHKEITKDSLSEIFDKVDELLKGKNLELIIGGPPCQAYSLAGRSRDKNKMLGDKRNYLYILYAEFLKRYKPLYFVFENVLGLLSAKDYDGISHFAKMQELFKECGYSIEYKILNANDYGILQNRKRIILVGKLGNHSGFYPKLPVTKIDATVRDIFCDLPSIKAGGGTAYLCETNDYSGKYLFDAKIKKLNREKTSLHWARPNKKQDLEIYKIAVDAWNKNKKRLNYAELPENLRTQNNTSSFLDRYKVVAADLKNSQTIVAHIAKDGHYFIHPDPEQNRSITPREAARLQTFPDDYYFESVSGIPARTTAYKQIGNAVPVLLAEKIAVALLEGWK